LNGYLLIPLFAIAVSTVIAVAILSQDPRNPLHRRAALAFAGASWWAVCDLLRISATDPETALGLVHLSGLGWAGFGPLGLDLLLRLAQRTEGVLRRALPWLYAVAAGFALLSVATGLLHQGVVRTVWGWGFVPGPLLLPFVAFVGLCLGAGLRVALSSAQGSASPVERALLSWIALGACIPLAVATLTDVALPFLGLHVVPLGAASFAFLGATISWAAGRHGHALLAPSALAREILDAIPDGVALLDLDGRIRNANPELARLLASDDVDALSGLPLLERIRGLGEGEGQGVECALESLRGEAVPVSVASQVLVDKRDRPFGRMLVLRDCREVADLRRRLVTAGRLAAVGELAAGIAHEINNPIAFVGSNLATLREYWSELAKDRDREGRAGEALRDGEELIDDCLEGIARVKQIVHDVKGFAHAGEDRSFVDVNALLDSALRVARPLLPGNARLEQFLSDVPHVRASARHLQQVFLNLVTNAAQAIEPTGTIRVQTSRAPEGVLVRVTDDGCGMAPDVLERVFDPFFTTKGVGEGTGLGLAISYQIVRSHGGEIRIDSAPGKGTGVRVFLPMEGAADGAAQTAAATGR
jgi:signal transduction histidine kinase